MRAILVLVLISCLAAGAWAADWGYDLADELMSPYCPGRALSECPSPNAEKLRSWILEQEQAGRSQAEVEEELYAQFGDQLRQSPKAEGVGLIAYAIPALAFALGGALVVFFLRRNRAGTAGAAVAGSGAAAGRPDDAELERMLDEEIGA